MAKSVTDYLIYSTSPDFAALIMTGCMSVILSVNPEDRWKKYTGKVLLHTTGFVTDPAEAEIAQETLNTLGMSDVIAANSIVARMIPGKIKQYDDINWEKDREKHGYVTSFSRFCANQNITGKELWGMEIVAVESLSEPVFDVLIDDSGRSYFWTARDPLTMEAVKLTLARENTVNLIEA